MLTSVGVQRWVGGNVLSSPWRTQAVTEEIVSVYLPISFSLSLYPSLVLGQAERSTSNTKSVGLNPDFCSIFAPVC